jgi:hypothetical protein
MYLLLVTHRALFADDRDGRWIFYVVIEVTRQATSPTDSPL